MPKGFNKDGTKGGFKKGHVTWSQGKTLSEETKRKIGIARKGNVPTNKGVPRVDYRGVNHPNWKGGVTSENEKIRHSTQYREWRKSVFERDDYTCQECGARNGNGKNVYLEADHIKPFAMFPELRFDTNNGRTLCKPCHRKTDTYGYRLPRILVTGGTGRLASELKKHLIADYVGIEHWDFCYPFKVKKYELVVHLGAFTDVAKAEIEKEKCFQTNVLGTFNLVQAYNKIPFVYISTEYANRPLGVYALTKKLGEDIVKTHPYHMILRTSFKPNPFPYSEAYGNQYTQGDYVDVIAKLLADKIKNWDRRTSEFSFLGTGRKTILELAQRTRPDVVENSVDEYNKKIGYIIPYDYQD